MSKRMIPADREKAILEAAISVAQKRSFSSMRLIDIAAAAECSNALVVMYFGTMTKMRRRVMRAAIDRKILPIIANGFAMGDPTAKKADDALIKKAMASLTN